MRYLFKMVIAWSLLSLAPTANAQVHVELDSRAAIRILDALEDPRFTMDAAREIARLPGGQGLIRKAISYGREADEESFARALVAAARGDREAPDPSGFRFANLRSDTDQIRALIDAFASADSALMQQVRDRIRLYSPLDLELTVRGVLIVGGTSGGFAFDDQEFFLNLDYFPVGDLAALVMTHELYHAIQSNLAPEETCTDASGNLINASSLFRSLRDEGTASWVGDFLLLPAEGEGASQRQRARVARGLGLAPTRAVTLLELSAFAMLNSADIAYQSIYGLGFYGDEILYSLGYIMARAIEDEHGAQAIPALLSQPNYRFVETYMQLSAYGESEAVPRLGQETARLVQNLAECSIS